MNKPVFIDYARKERKKKKKEKRKRANTQKRQQKIDLHVMETAESFSSL